MGSSDKTLQAPASPKPAASTHKPVVRKAQTDNLTYDVQQVMNIHHFEELMRLFKEEESCSFDIDRFREIFGKVFRGTLTSDQMTTLFMKIDANSDGTVDWNEFSSYMMMQTINSEQKIIVLDEVPVKFSCGSEQTFPHKDVIKRVEYVQKERKYVTVSRDGSVGIWQSNLKLQKSIDTKDFTFNMAWVCDAICLGDQGKLATVCDDRKLYIYDIFSLKPRLLAVLGPLEHVPICIDYAPRYDENNDLMLWGDSGGHVNLLYFNKRFFLDNVTEDKPAMVDPTQLNKKENQERYHMRYQKKKVHKDWVYKVRYFPELAGYVSSSVDPLKSIAIGDIERKTTRYFHVKKGVHCFEFCRRPSFLITGGGDKVLRLWNPYVLNKPAGSLSGHHGTITQICMDHEYGNIMSISEDKTLKIWSARSLQCLQSFTDKVVHRPENIISSMNYDYINRRLLMAHNQIDSYEPYQSSKNQEETRSHDAPIVAALFNESFHQVVTGCQNSVIKVWLIEGGEKTFQFCDLPDEDTEITTICFDKTRRRLLTGTRTGIIRMWNFNNGQLLQQMKTISNSEITQILYVETSGGLRYIVSVGWDRKVSLFKDDPGCFDGVPVKEFNGMDGMGLYRGHEDDILTVAFCASSGNLATASIDGKIIIWNIESGQVRGTMQDSLLDLRSPEEKPIEKLLFIQPKDLNPNEKSSWPLASCHSDGYLRLWNAENFSLITEVNCQKNGDEGLTAITTNKQGDEIFVGDNSGYVRVFGVNHANINTPNAKVCNMKIAFRAHIQKITSIEFIEHLQVILTSSKDMSVRVWAKRGLHIGIFGQENTWALDDELSYTPLPPDILNSGPNEPFHEGVMSSDDKKKMVMGKLKVSALGINQEFIDATENELKRVSQRNQIDIQILRIRVITKAALLKWQNHIEKRRQLQKLKNELSADYQPSKEFFKLNMLRKTPRPLRNINMQAEFAFHELPYHPLTEIILPPKPTPIDKNATTAGLSFFTKHV